MVTQPPPSTVEARIREIELNMERLSRVNTNVAPVPATEARSWLERWFPGISLVAFAAFAFWLGTISASVNNTAVRTDKVYSIVLESKDSLTARTSVIESQLDSIHSQLDGIDSQLDAINRKLDAPISPPRNNPSMR